VRGSEPEVLQPGLVPAHGGRAAICDSPTARDHMGSGSGFPQHCSGALTWP